MRGRDEAWHGRVAIRRRECNRGRRRRIPRRGKEQSMFTTQSKRRLMTALAALALVGVLAPTAPAEVHVRFGFGGHHGHHSYYKHRSHHGHHYRSHHGYHSYHRYRHHRSHYSYRHGYAPYRYHARSRHEYRRYGSPHVSGRSAARIVVTPRSRPAGSDYPTTQASGSDSRRRAAASTPSTVADGWRLLNDGHEDRAFNAFAAAAADHPRRGEPKLGYALAAAMRGDDDRAAFAMRRVHKYEPGVLDERLPVPDDVIGSLIERYDYQDTEDARLMVRSLKRLREAQ